MLIDVHVRLDAPNVMAAQAAIDFAGPDGEAYDIKQFFEDFDHDIRVEDVTVTEVPA